MKKLNPVLRGLTALFLVILALACVGYSVANTWRSSVDDVLGTSSYEINTDTDSATYTPNYEDVDAFMDAAKEHTIKQGEEGTVLMKNDGALPLSTSNDVALFGVAAYYPYPYSSGDLKAGNDDAVDLVGALEENGFTINASLTSVYSSVMNVQEVETTNAWTGVVSTSVSGDYMVNTSIGDMEEYQINEPPADLIGTSWTSAVQSGTVGICVFARPGGESNTYAPGTALDYQGNATGEDPLALSADELSIVDLAKTYCDEVVVLLNTGNAMEIGEIAEGGDHEVDAICYIGVPNDYHFYGIVNVLAGKANATGALTDTFVYDNESSPAMENFGGDYYSDYELGASNSTNGYDSRYPNTEIENTISESSFGGGTTYNGGQYIVEAEGIYVGYKYYETRYYDSIANPESNADSTAGSSTGDAWDYGDEVVYPFGYGLSYLEYEQNIKSVTVENTPEGEITAEIEITNNSDEDGYFLAQLYVQQPYTDYDEENLVEKSAVMFLNSGKTEVGAGDTEIVEISVPTKYLASYDYTAAQTYILDEGDYLFTAAAGSHEAVNNFLSAQGYTEESGMDAAGTGDVVTWNLDSFDKTTYATSNGTNVTNVGETADMNYWLPGTVTYLSRSDWEGTYPINYNEDVEISLEASSKTDDWLVEIRGQQHMISDTGEVENLNGADTGVTFSTEYIGYEQLTNIDDDYWALLVSGISADQAIGAVAHGGSQSDTLDNVDNPIVVQSEGVNGFTGTVDSVDGSTEYGFNISSQTLLGSSFNPDLAWEWGVIEGESGLWLEKYDVWGTGLTLRRTPYNGRNYEYISEDPMLTNRIGYGILGGCKTMGIINGPKHIGFNDQEHNRNGVAVYLNEQKMRETDLRGFQGGLEDAGGLAVMVAFNRLGPTNASHHVGLLKNILREEWGFTGIISTDMMNNAYYFNPEGCIMATVTQMADFAGDNSTISGGTGGVDSSWSYLSVDAVSNDSELVEAARLCMKYQLYTFANSAVLNVSTVRVTPWWETAIKTVIGVSAGLGGICGLAWIATSVVPAVKKEEKEEA